MRFLGNQNPITDLECLNNLLLVGLSTKTQPFRSWLEDENLSQLILLPFPDTLGLIEAHTLEQSHAIVLHRLLLIVLEPRLVGKLSHINMLILHFKIKFIMSDYHSEPYRSVIGIQKRLPQYDSLCWPPLSRQQNKFLLSVYPFCNRAALALVVWALPSWLGPLSPESRQKVREGSKLRVVATMPLKSSLFHQKLELIQIAFLNTCGLVYIAQQLISPPRLLPPMPTGPSSTLPLKNSLLNLPISSFSIKSRQRSPFPPIFSVGSYEYVYQLIRSLVFQMPTIIVSLILPSAINVFVVFCTSQATPKAALLGQKRFWPSWRRSKGYFLYGLSLQDGGQQRLSLRLLFRIVEWIGVVSMILFIVGLKLGYRGMMGASCEPAGSVNTTLAPIIHLVSLTNTFTLTLT